jgi:hypothetical protein
VNSEWVDRVSPPADRLDVKSEVSHGFPYKLPHADAVAGLLSRLIQSPAPKKGLITDLDNTLWKGILGEIGAAQISWDLDQKSHSHALYQELLRSLAAGGGLLAVASKNEPLQVEQAFARRDLILGKEHIFPFQVHWGPGVSSIARILEAGISERRAWFVDDSPLNASRGQPLIRGSIASISAVLGGSGVPRLRGLFPGARLGGRYPARQYYQQPPRRDRAFSCFEDSWNRPKKLT